MAQGHLPWSGDYESAMMGGWFIIAGTLWVGWRNKSLQALATATLPLVVMMMGYGVMRNPVLTPMAASLKNYWLYIHVYFAWLAFGAYTLAMAAGVLYVMKQKNAEQGVPNRLLRQVPVPGPSRRADLPLRRLRLHHRHHHDRRPARSGPRTCGGATGAGTRSRPGR